MDTFVGADAARDQHSGWYSYWGQVTFLLQFRNLGVRM